MAGQEIALPQGTVVERWVEAERRLTAAPERVYRAFADPEELARWLPLRIEGGLAVGGRSILVWPDKRRSWDVLEAIPNRRFVFRWSWSSGDELPTTATVTIEPVGYGSRAVVRDGPFLINQPDGLDAWSEALQGWAEALTMLRAYLDFSIDVRPRP